MIKTITLQVDGSIHIDNLNPRDIDPLMQLGNQVALAKGYCLNSFFKMLSVYPDLKRLSEFFPGMMQQFAKLTDSASESVEGEYLEFGKTVEMIGFPGMPRLDIFNSFRKTSFGDAIEIRSIGLPNLLNIPINFGPLHHIVFGDKVDVFEFDTAYTLFEFIDGIAWELGFLTTPGECQIRR